ncbi:MAG: PUA domain-containing protein, partial [Pseudomonadota bacterium]
GMASKIAAAKIAGGAGCATIIAEGACAHPLAKIASGARATLILAAETRERARRQWIAGRLKPLGELAIDNGAAAALSRGSSLLPAGVTRVFGDFQRGDAVSIVDAAGAVIGQGLSAYSAMEIVVIAGKKSDEIEAILGYRRRPAVIEKNDLVLKKQSHE